MVGRNTAVSGIYRLKELAERALDTLIAGAIPCSSISVVLLDSADPNAAGAGKDHGVIGGTIGILAGVSAVTVPGLGRMIGAGPVMAGLATAGRGGPQPSGADSGLVRALVGIGISEREAERCEAHVRNGGTLLSVCCSCAQQALRARNLLAGTGAIDTKVESGDTRVARLLGGF